MNENRLITLCLAGLLVGGSLQAMQSPEQLGNELINAASIGELAEVKTLLDKGAPVNQTTRDGRTALMGAARKGHLEVIRLLLDNGAQVNLASKNGWTALMMAALEGRLEVVRFLLNNGAKEIDTAVNADSQTALIVAAASMGIVGIGNSITKKEVCKTLIDAMLKLTEEQKRNITIFIGKSTEKVPYNRDANKLTGKVLAQNYMAENKAKVIEQINKIKTGDSTGTVNLKQELLKYVNEKTNSPSAPTGQAAAGKEVNHE